MYICFLGYKNNETKIINFLKKNDCKVDVYGNVKLDKKIIKKNYDLIISSGYKHIIKNEILNNIKRAPINIHPSLLPYNKGRYPVFWSFYNNTPQGVTIHLIDSSIDGGDIIFSKKIIFSNNKMTFKKAFNTIKEEGEKLFIKNWNLIKSQKYKQIKQNKYNYGSYNKKEDFIYKFKWDENVKTVIEKLKNKI